MKTNIPIAILFIIINLFLGSGLFGNDGETISGTAYFKKLMKSDQLDKAWRFIERNRGSIGRQVQQRLYSQLGDAFHKAEKYQRALDCYDRIPTKSRQVRKKIAELSISIGENWMSRGNSRKAIRYLRMSTDPDIQKRLTQLISGEEKLAKGKKQAALALFQQSAFPERIAQFYQAEASLNIKNKQTEAARKNLNRAIETYETILKSFNKKWTDSLNKQRRRCIDDLNRLSKNKAEKDADRRLKTILNKLGKYCAQLENRSFFFYCEENIRETIDYSILGSRKRFGSVNPGGRKKSGKHLDHFVYSYQLIQKNGEIKETRKFLRYAGKKKKWLKRNEQDRTRVMLAKIIFGPIGIFSYYWQPYFDYKLLGKEKLGNDTTYIVECIPKYPFTSIETHQNQLFGKAWVNASDYTVLKIQWEPKSIGYANRLIEFRRDVYPKFKFDLVSEYRLKKAGIRYPTNGYYREYFADKAGREDTLLKLEVLYNNFKFFNVETNTEISPLEEMMKNTR